jgi:hypothetical protein
VAKFQKNATLSSATMMTVEAQGLDHLKQEAPRALTLTLELKAASSRPGYNWIAAAGERPSQSAKTRPHAALVFAWLKAARDRAGGYTSGIAEQKSPTKPLKYYIVPGNTSS